jgi:hypothetical protein
VPDELRPRHPRRRHVREGVRDDLRGDAAAGGFYHPHDARRSQTTLDYVVWRERVFWAELKAQHGRLSQDRWVKDRCGRQYFIKGQKTVVAELRAAGQTVYIWRPSDIPEIARVLFGEAVDPLPCDAGTSTCKGSTGAQLL